MQKLFMPFLFFWVIVSIYLELIVMAAENAATCVFVGPCPPRALACYDWPMWLLSFASSPWRITLSWVRPLGSAATVMTLASTGVRVRPPTSTITAVWWLPSIAAWTPPSQCYRNNHLPALTLARLLVEFLKSVAFCRLQAYTLACLWVQDLVAPTGFRCFSRALTYTFVRVEVLLSVTCA